MKKYKVAFTGGGTAGHVFPAFPVIDRLLKKEVEVFWIGCSNGMEKELVKARQIHFIGIQGGKLRRYFSIRNFLDIFLIVIGFIQSLCIFICNRPNIVFSKGGFVSVPPVAAACLLKIKCFTHESDIHPGLATRINYHLNANLLLSFKESLTYLSQKTIQKAKVVGNPIRDELLDGDPKQAEKYLQISENHKPILLVIGGSLGAEQINQLIYEILEELLVHCFVVHQTGINDKNQHKKQYKNYYPFDFIYNELSDFYAAATLCISRCGASSLWELGVIGIPSIFIPLRNASRGDQIINAKLAEEIGFSKTLEHNQGATELLNLVSELINNPDQIKRMQEAAKQVFHRHAAQNIIDIILKTGGMI